MHQRIVGEGRVLGDPFGEFDGFVARLTLRHEVLREAHALAVLCVVNAAGEHHVGHARGADQPRNAHRAATAHKNSTRTFGQGVERALVRHANVARACQFEPAADHGAMQRSNHGGGSELNRVQGRMPHARVQHAGARVAFLQFREVEPGAKVIALAVQHDCTNGVGEVFKHLAQAQDQSVAERVAFGGTAEPNDGNGAANVEVQIFVGHEMFANPVDYCYKS